MAVCLRTLLLPPHLPSSPHRLRQLLQHLHRRFPVHAGIRDAHALLQRRRPLRRDLLVPLVEVRLDHHAHDGFLPRAELVADRLRDLGLVPVVLERVSVRAINHHRLSLSLLP